MKHYLRHFGILSITFVALLSLSVPMKKPSGGFHFANLQRMIKLMPEAKADGPGSFADVVRMLTFLIVGFPDDATYTDLTHAQPDSDSGPPKEGLVGFVQAIAERAGLATGKTTCSELPTSGSFSATDAEGTFTITYLTADQLVPEGYTNAGETYAKAFTVDLDGARVLKFSFNCNDEGTAANAGFALFNFPEEGSSTRLVNLVYESVNGAPKADFANYLDSDMNERLQLHFEGSSSQFQLHMTRAALDDDGTGVQGARIHAKGVPSAHTTSFLQIVSADTMEALAGDSNADSLSTSGTLNAATGVLLCTDLSDVDSTTLGGCDGLTLDTPPTPYWSGLTYKIKDAAGTAFASTLRSP